MSKFVLLSKSIGIKYTQYKGGALKLSKFAPYTVDEVVVGSKANPDLKKKITTFRNSKGEITERVFDYPNKPLWNRLYSIEENKNSLNELVVTRTKNDYKLNRNIIDYYMMLTPLLSKNKFILWEHTSSTLDHVAYNLDNCDVILSQVKIKNKPRGSCKHHEFVEYPIMLPEEKSQASIKRLSFDVRGDNSVIKKSIKSTNSVEIPVQDRYLGFRALTIDDAKIPFTKKYLSERNMSDKDIKIVKNYNPINEDDGFNAIFNAEEGVINFNKDANFYSKSKLANTARHEVEHTWQFYLQALLNGGGTPWQTDMFNKFGKITDKKSLKEARVYDKSIQTYVPYNVDRVRYRRNYIEIKARQMGELEQEKYDFDGISIRNSFKHIPAKFL